MPRSFFYFRIKEFTKVLVIHQFFLTKNKPYAKKLAEMDSSIDDTYSFGSSGA
jgi:hypothetical protein